MKIVVDSMPDSPSECLFCANLFTDMCNIDDSLCYLSLKYKCERKCPYLIELKEVNKMTVYELIQKLIDYPPDTEILFKCIDDKFVSYDCNFQYKKILNELHIELE